MSVIANHEKCIKVDSSRDTYLFFGGKRTRLKKRRLASHFLLAELQCVDAKGAVWFRHHRSKHCGQCARPEDSFQWVEQWFHYCFTSDTAPALIRCLPWRQAFVMKDSITQPRGCTAPDASVRTSDEEYVQAVQAASF